MAAGELISAAVGILLLIIVAYVLIGTTLSTAEIVASAQNDITLIHETRLRTGITFTNITSSFDGLNFNVSFNARNSGTEIIGDLSKMEVFLTWSGSEPVRYPFGDGSAGTWNATGISPDIIHPNQLDPNENLTAVVETLSTKPNWIQITTGNGVYASAPVP